MESEFVSQVTNYNTCVIDAKGLLYEPGWLDTLQASGLPKSMCAQTAALAQKNFLALPHTLPRRHKDHRL